MLKSMQAGGDYVDSFTSKYLRQEDGHLVTDDRLNEWIKWTAEGLYVGGGDTVGLCLFILADI